MDWRLALVAFSVLPLIVAGHAVVPPQRPRVVPRRCAPGSRGSTRSCRSTSPACRRCSCSGARRATFARVRRRSTARTATPTSQSIFYYAVFYPAIEVIGALAAALIIWFGGGWVLQGTLTLGSLVAFLQYSQRFFRPISDMSEKFNVLQAAMASSERIFELLDTPVKIAARPTAPRRAAAGASAAAGTSSFEHVWFAYNDERATSCATSRSTSQPGERVGIVGATGAGKTTIINLLLRFYDVSSGRILVDGVDIREMDLHALRRAVRPGAAGRAPVLGHDRRQHPAGQRATSRTSRCGARREAVHADRFIDALPDGYDTPVAERGATLSVGQKQLLSFARALAFDPRDPGPRRGDVERRHRDRAADPRRAARADGRPDDDRDRAPAVDDPGHGQDPGAAQGRAARGGHAPGAAGPARHLSTSCISCSSRTRSAAGEGASTGR